jgi:hypothetical protein
MGGLCFRLGLVVGRLRHREQAREGRLQGTASLKPDKKNANPNGWRFFLQLNAGSSQLLTPAYDAQTPDADPNLPVRHGVYPMARRGRPG